MALSQALYPLFYSTCCRCCSHSSIVHCGPATGAVPIFYSSLWPCCRCCSHSFTVPVAGAVPTHLQCLLQVLFPLFYGACCRCCSHSSLARCGPIAGTVILGTGHIHVANSVRKKSGYVIWTTDVQESRWFCMQQKMAWPAKSSHHHIQHTYEMKAALTTFHWPFKLWNTKIANVCFHHNVTNKWGISYQRGSTQPSWIFSNLM